MPYLDSFPQNALDKARDVRMLVLDVDGVLSDGRLYYGEQGEAFKSFHSRDGFGMKRLMENGIEIAIITGRVSEFLSHRMRDLEIERVYQGREAKMTTYKELIQDTGLDNRQIAYMGDDINDLQVMRHVGFATTVANPHPLVAEEAHWISDYDGGRGAVRQLCDLLLHSQGLLEPELEKWS